MGADEIANGAGSGVLTYNIKDLLELNLSYMPFITEGGLFVPSTENYSLGDLVWVDLQLPGKKDKIRIEGKVIWITPKNALHHVLPGIGLEFVGPNAEAARGQIKSSLNSSFDTGGYTYGITDGVTKEKK